MVSNEFSNVVTTIIFSFINFLQVQIIIHFIDFPEYFEISMDGVAHVVNTQNIDNCQKINILYKNVIYFQNIKY